MIRTFQKILIILICLTSVSLITKQTKAADIDSLKLLVDEMEIIKNDVINGKQKTDVYLAKYTEYQNKIGQINEEFQVVVDEKAKIVKELTSNEDQLELALVYYQEAKPGEKTVPINKKNDDEILNVNSSTQQIASTANETVTNAQIKLQEIEVKNNIIKAEGDQIATQSKRVFEQETELRKVGKLESNGNSYENFEAACKANPDSSETCKNYNQYKKELTKDPASLGGSIVNNGISAIRKDNPSPKATPEKVIAANVSRSTNVKQVPTSFGVINTEGSCRPSTGVIRQEFGYTDFAIAGAYGGGPHTGIDLNAGYGSPIYAAFDGTVIEATPYNGAWGNSVMIKHIKDGIIFYTRYAHLSAITVANGEQVKACQQVGREGTTGYSTGPHLHFGVYIGGTDESNAVNPVNVIKI